jgi:hypothetical protein
MEKLSALEEALKNQKKPVQTLERAEENKKEADEAIEFANKFKSQGRPKVSDKEKKKMRSFYLSDDEVLKIERVAKINGMKTMEFVRFALEKEMRKEGIEL